MTEFNAFNSMPIPPAEGIDEPEDCPDCERSLSSEVYELGRKILEKMQAEQVGNYGAMRDLAISQIRRGHRFYRLLEEWCSLLDKEPLHMVPLELVMLYAKTKEALRPTPEGGSFENR